MHASLEKVSTVPCAEHRIWLWTKCVVGFFTEPGFSAIESVGRVIKDNTLIDIKDASEVFCSGTMEICHYGIKYIFDKLKTSTSVPTMKIEGVRMPVGYNWCDPHAAAVPLRSTASHKISKRCSCLERQSSTDD